MMSKRTRAIFQIIVALVMVIFTLGGLIQAVLLR